MTFEILFVHFHPGDAIAPLRRIYCNCNEPIQAWGLFEALYPPRLGYTALSFRELTPNFTEAPC
jgi:hypothetical protein